MYIYLRVGESTRFITV